MTRQSTWFGLALTLTLGLSASSARAETKKVIAPGGGLQAVSVEIEGTKLTYRRCKVADCTDTGATQSLPMPLRPDAAAATIEAIPVGDGRSVVRVRVPDTERKDLAFEALLSGQADAPIFAGLTGFALGSEGDRAGNVVLVYDRDEKSKFVIVAESREDTRICGQTTTPLAPRGIDGRSMQLRGATLHRIEKTQRDAATELTAKPRVPNPPLLARVLVATGGSAPGSGALTDGKLDGAWSEQRPGDGHGEFATMRAPFEVPIVSLVIVPTPTKPKAEGAAPHTIFVATDTRLFRVNMPEDAWGAPEKAFEVTFPEPVKTTCLAVVLDEAYGHSGAPEVSIAEISAVSKFDADGAKLADLAHALATPRGEEAAALLRRAGNDGLTAVVAEYPKLDGRGRALAVDVASSTGTCDGPGAELLTHALADKDTEVRKRALGRIERCGKAAGPALVAAVKSEDEARRAAAAPLLAAVASSIAIEPLAEQMGKGSSDTRRAVRSAYARAATSAPRTTLLAEIAKRDMPVLARLDLLRATGQQLPQLRPESDVAIADLLRASPDMPTRYLLAQPLASLARTPDATAGELSRLAELVRRDPDPAVRAHAVEVSAGIGPLVPQLIAAAADPNPRVREAALKALGTAGMPTAIASAAQASTSKREPWTFVRVAAIDALGTLPQDTVSTAALVSALEDPSPKVRMSALGALGKHKVSAEAGKIRERLEDAKEDPDVRAMAARTLGVLCVQDAADRLTKLAMNARSPVDESDDRIGMAAIEALGTLHPADLEKRLAPLRSKDARLPVQRAANRALAEKEVCR